MNLTLTKPLAFFDIEATGTDVAKDRICSISFYKLIPNESPEIKSRLINPGMQMSDEVIAIHGITNEMVANQPNFSLIAKGLYNFLSGCDLAGFNSNNFDIPILVEEFLRVGIDFPDKGTRFIDVGNIMKKKEERSLSAAVKFYLGEDMQNAHNAEADTLATFRVFEAQMVRYGLPDNIDELAKFSAFDNRVDFAGKIIKDDKGEYRYNFGPHKGELVMSDLGFAEWMLMKDFSRNTKKVVMDILKELSNVGDGPEDDDDEPFKDEE